MKIDSIFHILPPKKRSLRLKAISYLYHAFVFPFNYFDKAVKRFDQERERGHPLKGSVNKKILLHRKKVVFAGFTILPA